MGLYQIFTTDYKHFNSLMRDYVKQGFILETHNPNEVVLLSNNEQIKINLER